MTISTKNKQIWNGKLYTVEFLLLFCASLLQKMPEKNMEHITIMERNSTFTLTSKVIPSLSGDGSFAVFFRN